MKKWMLAAAMAGIALNQGLNVGQNTYRAEAAPAVKPTPKPTPKPQPTPQPAMVKMTFRAAIILGSGDIKPVPREDFLACPYSEEQVAAGLKAMNAPVKEPEKTDYTDPGEHEKDWNAWRSGRNKLIKDVSNGRTCVTLKTDLRGEATISLPVGTWYMNGYYSINGGKSNVFWTDVRVDVTKDTTVIELSNDNGEVINVRR